MPGVKMKHNVMNGLVAFIDILGYNNLIENNELEIVAELISDELVKIDEHVKQAIKDNFSFLPSEIATDIGNIVSSIAISDSILLTAQIDENQSNEVMGLVWLVFIIACQRLTRRLFLKGLPTRGAVSYGQFFVAGNCFAGIPIVDAYNLSQRLELSGCVLTSSARIKVKDLLSSGTLIHAKKILNLALINYLVPLKGGELKEHVIINFLAPNCDSDINKFVLDSFQGYNKAISEKVMQKIKNTEMMFRFFIENNERVYRITKTMTSSCRDLI